MAQSFRRPSQSQNLFKVGFEKFSLSLSHFAADVKTPYEHFHDQGKNLRLFVRKEKVQSENGRLKTDIMLRICIGGKELDVMNLSTLLIQTTEKNEDRRRIAKVVDRLPRYMALSLCENGTMMKSFQFKFYTENDYKNFRQVFQTMGFEITRSLRAAEPRSALSAGSSSSDAPALVAASHTAAITIFPENCSKSASRLRSVANIPIGSQELQLASSRLRDITSGAQSFHFPDTRRQASIQPDTGGHELSRQLTSGYFDEAAHCAAKFQEPEISLPSRSQQVVPALRVDDANRLRASVAEFENKMKDLKSRYADSSDIFDPTTDVVEISRPFTTAEIPVQHVMPNLRPASTLLEIGTSRDLLIPPRRAPPSILKSGRSKEVAAPPMLPNTIIKDRNDTRTPIDPRGSVILSPVVSPITPTVKRSAILNPLRDKEVNSRMKEAHIGEGRSQTCNVYQGLGQMLEESEIPLATRSNNIQHSSSTSTFEAKMSLSNKRSSSKQSSPRTKRPRMVDVGIQVTRSISRASTSVRPNTHAAATELVMHSSTLEADAEVIHKYITMFKSSRRELFNTSKYQNGATQEGRDMLYAEWVRNNLMDQRFVEMASDLERQHRRIGLEPYRD